MAINVGELIYTTKIDNSKAISDNKKLQNEINETTNELKQNETQTTQNNQTNKESAGILSSLNNSYTKLVAGIGATTVAFNKFSNATLTADLNNAKLQSSLNATDEEMKALEQSNEELGNSYLFTQGEIARMSALNATYVDTADEVAQANLLVAQTATLYAIKEGDVSSAGDMAVTSQEALRDVILTGSTTAFEDAGISLDVYSQKIVESMGYTDAQVESLTEGTNGLFEYTEALSKSATPQARFNALSATTNEQMEDMAENMSLAGKSALAFQRLLVALKDALATIGKVISIVAGAIAIFVGQVFKAVSESKIFTAVVAILKAVLGALVGIFAKLLPYVERLTELVMNGAIAFGIYKTAIFLTSGGLTKLIIKTFAQAKANLALIKTQILLHWKIALVIAGIFLLITALKSNEKVVKFVNAAFEKFKEILNLIAPYVIALAQIIGGVLNQVLTNLVAIAQEKLIPIFEKIANIITTKLLPAISNLVQFIASLLIPILESLKPVLQALVPLIKQLAILIGVILAAAVQIILVLLQFFKEILIILQPIIQVLGEVIMNILVAALNILAVLLQKVAVIIETVLMPIIQVLANIITAVLNVALTALNAILETIVIPILEILTTVLEKIINIVNRLAEIITNLLIKAFENFKMVLENVVIPVLNRLNQIFDKAVEKVKKLADIVKNTLAKAFELVAEPIERIIDLFNQLFEAIGRVTSAITEGLTNAFNSIPVLPDIGGSSASIETGVSASKKAGSNLGTSNNFNRNINNNSNLTNSFNANFNIGSNSTARQVQKGIQSSMQQMNFTEVSI